jgi:hypothetical protein
MVCLSKYRINTDAAASDIKSLGFDPKFTLKNQYTAEFCSSVFLPTRNSFVLVPKLGRFLVKVGLTLTDGYKRPYSHNLGLALAYRSLHSEPIYGLYVDKLLDLSKGFIPTFKEKDRHSYQLPEGILNFNVFGLDEFYIGRYGYSVDDIRRSLNSTLAGVKSLPCNVVWGDIIKEIIATDCGL